MKKLVLAFVALSLLVGCLARQSNADLRVAISKAVAEVFDSEKGWLCQVAGNGGSSGSSVSDWTFMVKATIQEAEGAMRSFQERLEHDLGSSGATIDGGGESNDGFEIEYKCSSGLGVIWARSAECRDGQVKVFIFWHAVL